MLVTELMGIYLDTFKDIWGPTVRHHQDDGPGKFRYLQGYMGTAASDSQLYIHEI